MLRLSLASHYHWTQRPDYNAEKASIGFWQTARIYALLGQVENARRYGQLALASSQEKGVDLFCLAYAYEALARAEMVAGNRAKMNKYLAEAKKVTERIGDEETKKMLAADFASIG